MMIILYKDIIELTLDKNKNSKKNTNKQYNRNSISRIFTSIYKTFNLSCSIPREEEPISPRF